MAEDGAKRSREARGERNKESFCKSSLSPLLLVSLLSKCLVYAVLPIHRW
jgi:hypothetical protein